MVKSTLSSQDVEKLLAERSADARAETAAKLASQIREATLSPVERQLAFDIVRLMARDAEVRVRQALAVNLKESAAVPHDVAVTLARDVDAVALPILEFSQALNDSDLIEIVHNQEVRKLVAIARRPSVSSEVSQALVDTGHQEVVVTLVANDGADISEGTLQTIVDDFGSEAAVQGSLVQRANLPVTVAERLMAMVSEQLREHLVKQNRLTDQKVAEIITQSRERATITLAAGADRDDVEGLVRHLNANRRLTPSIMLRAICMGDMTFFEAGMAELAGVPRLNASLLIHDSGGLGFKAIFDKAKLRAPLFPAFRCALDVARENAFDGGEQDRERFCRRMIERILTKYEQQGVSFNSKDLEYLLAKMNQLPATLGSHHA